MTYSKKKVIIFSSLLLLAIALSIFMLLAYWNEEIRHIPESQFTEEDRELVLSPEFKNGAVRLAISKRDIGICSYVQPEEAFKNCMDEYQLYLGLKKDRDYCKKIENEGLREFCSMIISGEYDCDNLSVKGWYLISEENVIPLCRTAAGYPECELIEDFDEKDICLSLPVLIDAVKKKDSQVCELLEKNSDKFQMCKLISQK